MQSCPVIMWALKGLFVTFLWIELIEAVSIVLEGSHKWGEGWEPINFNSIKYKHSEIEDFAKAKNFAKDQVWFCLLHWQLNLQEHFSHLVINEDTARMKKMPHSEEAKKLNLTIVKFEPKEMEIGDTPNCAQMYNAYKNYEGEGNFYILLRFYADFTTTERPTETTTKPWSWTDEIQKTSLTVPTTPDTTNNTEDAKTTERVQSLQNTAANTTLLEMSTIELTTTIEVTTSKDDDFVTTVVTSEIDTIESSSINTEPNGTEISSSTTSILDTTSNRSTKWSPIKMVYFLSLFIAYILGKTA